MTVALIGYRRWCVAHGEVACLGEVTLELRLETGIGGEAGGERKGRVFQEEGTTYAKNGRLEKGWRCEHILGYTCFSQGRYFKE